MKKKILMKCVCEQVQELFVKYMFGKADCEGHAVMCGICVDAGVLGQMKLCYLAFCGFSY